MAIYRIQPSAFTDQITSDGHQLTKLPYPFYADASGAVQRQDIWNGKVTRVIGFQRDLARSAIDLRWADAVKNPAEAVGMYLVTSDKAGDWGTHHTAVQTMELVTTDE
jgi:hypothetical protein